MPRRRLLDDAQSADVVRRYGEGWRIAELADELGVSTRVIHGRLIEAGVERRSTGRRRSELDVDELARRYETGASMLQLARETGLDRKAVHRALVDAGVTIDSRRRTSLPEGGRLPADDGTSELPHE